MPAARRAADWYQGTVICRDIPGAPSQTVDFDIELGSGELVALEVTTHRDPEEAEMPAAVAEHRLRVGGLSRAWSITCLTSTRMLGLGKRLEPLLRQMEMRGDDCFLASRLTREDYERNPHDVRCLLVEEGIVAAWYAPPPAKATEIVVSWTPSTSDLAAFVAQAVPPRHTNRVPPPAPDGGGIDQRKLAAVLEAVDQESKANAVKLGKCGRERRELWIWCDTSLTRMALQSLLPPRKPHPLPPEITAVWVGVDTDRGIYSWRYAPREGWTVAPESGQPPLVGPPMVRP